MRSAVILVTLALVLACGLFALTRTASADALAAYSRQLSLTPQSSVGCGCLGCNCISCG